MAVVPQGALGPTAPYTHLIGDSSRTHLWHAQTTPELCTETGAGKTDTGEAADEKDELSSASAVLFASEGDSQMAPSWEVSVLSLPAQKEEAVSYKEPPAREEKIAHTLETTELH